MFSIEPDVDCVGVGQLRGEGHREPPATLGLHKVWHVVLTGRDKYLQAAGSGMASINYTAKIRLQEVSFNPVTERLSGLLSAHATCQSI